MHGGEHSMSAYATIHTQYPTLSLSLECSQIIIVVIRAISMQRPSGHSSVLCNISANCLPLPLPKPWSNSVFMNSLLNHNPKKGVINKSLLLQLVPMITSQYGICLMDWTISVSNNAPNNFITNPDGGGLQ